MKLIDGDIKRALDELTETKNNLNQLVKKEGNNFLTKDLSEVIYTSQRINPENHFVERHNTEYFSTVIAVVHK